MLFMVSKTWQLANQSLDWRELGPFTPCRKEGAGSQAEPRAARSAPRAAPTAGSGFKWVFKHL